MLSETWEDQYRRMHRSHALLKRAADEYIDREEIHEEANSRDILYHFCADAYHLKDYIKNTTGQSQAVKTAVEQLFNVQTGSKTLAACADVANGFKHLDLRTPRFPGGGAEVASQAASMRLPITLGGQYFTYHFQIEAGGTTYSELELADQATAAWDAWLPSNGLPLPSL
jgi:hypothetical protein